MSKVGFWRALLLVSLLPVFGWANTSLVSAKTLTLSGKIQLSGRVLPAHYVIVNDSGAIIEVISNTSEDTTPLIYKNKLDKANQLPLTEAVYTQYLKIIPPGSSRLGVLYKAVVAEKPAPKQTADSQKDKSVNKKTTELSVSNNFSGFEQLLKTAFPNSSLQSIGFLSLRS